MAAKQRSRNASGSEGTRSLRVRVKGNDASSRRDLHVTGRNTAVVAARRRFLWWAPGSNLVAPAVFGLDRRSLRGKHAGVQVTFPARDIAEHQGDSRRNRRFRRRRVPLTVAQKRDGQRTLTQFPTVLVAIAPICKLPGQSTTALFRRVTRRDISGKHQELARSTHRQAKSRHTSSEFGHYNRAPKWHQGFELYFVADFLSRTSAEWKSKIGKSAAPSWPVGIEINRSQGMVAKVSESPGPSGTSN